MQYLAMLMQYVKINNILFFGINLVKTYRLINQGELIPNDSEVSNLEGHLSEQVESLFTPTAIYFKHSQ